MAFEDYSQRMEAIMGRSTWEEIQQIKDDFSEEVRINVDPVMRQYSRLVDMQYKQNRPFQRDDFDDNIAQYIDMVSHAVFCADKELLYRWGVEFPIQSNLCSPILKSMPYP